MPIRPETDHEISVYCQHHIAQRPARRVRLGLVYMLRARGAEVIFAIATRGGKGRTGAAKDHLEALRTAHQSDAAAILGGARVIFHDYPDKQLSNHIEDFARDLAALIQEERPDLVLGWDPDYIYNPHPDHQTAAEAFRLAAAGSKICYYGTREPDLWIGCDKPLFQVKLEAIRAHRTETSWYFFPIPKRQLVKRSRREGLKIGCSYAEVLRCSDHI